MERWFILSKGADFEEIARKYGVSQVLARLIRNRDVVGDEEIRLYLEGTIADLHDGMLMKDMDRAVEILEEKICLQKKIRVIGDYDIDGVNATYILQRGLQELGGDVDTDIPDRVRDGYGLSRSLIERAVDDGVDTIVTCDNGIAAMEEIRYGKEQGLTILVTDHHKVPFVETEEGKQFLLPPADAVVDPQREDCEYPFQGLCGAAVAYKLVEALCICMGRDVEDFDDLMENVAMATVGDVMDLVGENRIFVRQGLQMMSRTRNPGLRALIQCCGIEEEELSAYHIGFVLGPCLNASGRLDTAKQALELLNAKTISEGMEAAERLKELNEVRKQMTQEGVERAKHLVEEEGLSEDRVLVIDLPDCHESIAGIVAGRIREEYFRPVFVLTRAESGRKGSGRSIPEYDMYTELNRCRELFTRFGGHRQAAGLSLAEENVVPFRQKINALCTLTKEDLARKVEVDLVLPFSYATEDLAMELKKLEPFGKGNPKPVFALRHVKVSRPEVAGKNRRVLKCLLEDEWGVKMEGIYFGEVEHLLNRLEQSRELDLAFQLLLNEYRGKRKIQIRIINFR